MKDTMIVNNETVGDFVEEVTENTCARLGMKIAANIGLGLLVSYATYKYVAKPLVAFVKTKIDKKHVESEVEV